MNETQRAKAFELVQWLRWFVRNTQDPSDFRWEKMSEAANTIESLLAEPEPAPEPAAWLYTKALTNQFAAVVRRIDPSLFGADEWLETPLYTHPPKAEPAPEPVAATKDELLQLVEKLQTRYRLSFLGSEKAMLHFARDWAFLTEPDARPAPATQEAKT